MNIEQVNATLNRAIESFQESELLMLWEFSVPTPHEMHRKVGMRLPKGSVVVPDPEQVAGRGGMVDADYARSHAAKTPAEFNTIFKKLKPKQIVWVSYNSVMAGRHDYEPFTVGRRGHSKKHNSTSITLLYPGQKKGGHRGMQPRLYKHGDDYVGLAIGDLAVRMIGMYVQKK